MSSGRLGLGKCNRDVGGIGVFKCSPVDVVDGCMNFTKNITAYVYELGFGDFANLQYTNVEQITTCIAINLTNR